MESLLELEAKAIDPARYSVQSRSEVSSFAPTSDVQGAGGIFWITLASNAQDEAPAYNVIYPNWRDRYLQEFSRSEAMLASAKYSMKTRISTLNFRLNGPPRAKKFASELLDKPGLGDTLQTIVQKVSDDLDGSDNGAFLELWRAGSPTSDAGNRPVLGFAHLDSRQCWRSFDPEFPVWYTNPITGQIRKIHRSRIVFTADNPSSIELARGIGFCAVSRVLRMARVFRNMQIYLDEKVGGRFTRAIGAINGITAGQLRRALQQNEDDGDSKGFVIYKQIPFLTNPSGESANDIKFAMQDLASLPDGFVFRDDADLYAYILAFCFGVDAREFWPATQSGATKADASVQNMKARGRGIGNRIETIEYMIRQALPETVSFEYDFTDDDQDKMTAEINKLRTDTFKVYVDMGALQSYEAKALAIAAGILDGEILATLQQPLTSDSNPGTPDDAPAQTETDEGTSNNQSETASEKSYSTYRTAMRSYTRQLWNGELAAYDAFNGMESTITRNFEKAWAEGALQCGVYSDELTDDEFTALEIETQLEISHLGGFVDAIVAGSKANGGDLQPLLNRADAWAQGYNRIVSRANVMACADKKLKWKRNPAKDSCEDCVALDGQVRRGSTWGKVGIYPKSHDLACFGINCGCEWEITDEPISKGKLPSIVGHKHIHLPVIRPIIAPSLVAINATPHP